MKTYTRTGVWALDQLWAAVWKQAPSSPWPRNLHQEYSTEDELYMVYAGCLKELCERYGLPLGTPPARLLLVLLQNDELKLKKPAPEPVEKKWNGHDGRLLLGVVAKFMGEHPEVSEREAVRRYFESNSAKYQVDDMESCWRTYERVKYEYKLKPYKLVTKNQRKRKTLSSEDQIDLDNLAVS